ncbi:MAG: lipid biosynthesis acyltransferase [Proteobacteria bacterium]|nr:lipid biosynthesis acyltransferase [Pseudomonadota bacterium]
MVFFYRLLSCIPLCLVHVIGGLLGWLTYLASPTYRHNLKANMAQAGIDPALRSAAIAEAGKQALEPSHIWLHNLPDAAALAVEIDGAEHVKAAQAAGKGIVYLTPHLGCFEIIAQYLSTLAEITVLFRPPKNAGLQTLIEAGRRRPHLHLAPADLSGVRALIKALKKGQAIGLLPDQAPRVGEGIWLDFFGRPAYTMTLAARLTETGATTLFVWGERLPGGKGFRLRFRPPLQEFTGDTVARAHQINHEIEDLIRQKPEQYLWGYNRYKRPAGAEPPPGSNGEPH